MIIIKDIYNVSRTLMLESISRIISKINCIEWHTDVHLYIKESVDVVEIIANFDTIPNGQYLGTIEDINIEFDKIVLNSTTAEIFDNGKLYDKTQKLFEDFILKNIIIDNGRILIIQSQ